ncbi:MAG: hypothetical protein Q8R78_04660 [Candidatus Omnitrophota bacterium]|nr:hypothetical protein [Candidatus Omnitrophota bacterium]
MTKPKRQSKIPLPIEDYRQALNYAEADVQEHWETYQAQYLKELEHHEE